MDKEINKRLINEWNYLKNQNLKPEDFKKYSNKKVWWICAQGHEWEAKISNRIKGNGCPYCTGKRPILGETDLVTVSPELVKQWNYRKNENLRPEDFTSCSNKKVWWICSQGHEWEAMILNRNKGIGCPYCSGRYPIPGKTDLVTVNPDLAKQWNYGKNGSLRPEDYSSYSNKKVWWVCSQNHEWKAMILSRSSGKGCPYCSSRYAILGKTDLVTVNPKIAKQWNYGKNGSLRPEDYSSYSKKKVWWLCPQGHEWEATISNRSLGNGCPYCSGRYPIPGKTDLATVNPDLAKQWNFQKNGMLRPENYSLYSNKKVWWLCPQGHEWEATIEKRSNGRGCPYCAEKRAILGKTDLVTVNPDLAKQWNYKKNKMLRPENFTLRSSKKVWWVCSQGHEWEATIDGRSNGRGCPYCTGKRAILGKTDLKTVNPDLVKQWNYKKNENLSPESFTLRSSKKVWWVCPQGHEWKASIDKRSDGRGCPYCTRKKHLK